MKLRQIGLLFAVLLQCTAPALAGGPLLSNRNGMPVVYPESAMPLSYRVDPGALGLFTNAEAVAVVDDSYAVWQAVPTASVSFVNAGFLPEDVNENNYKPYFDNDSDGVSPVIFDSDGAIIDTLYGIGASESIIGFSGSSYAYDEASGSYRYAEGLTLLNGRFTRSPYNWGAEVFKATFVHEFGHFIGLDHSQINRQYVHDGDAANDIYIPTMFPTATDDDTSLGDLNPDDKAALTLLYPAGAGVVDGAYGRIRGRLRWLSGLPARGANIVAVRQGDELMSRFSSVSDYAKQGDGAFEMLVTPGTYRFIVEPVYPQFRGGSSVGPYAEFAFSRSFIFPPVRAEYEESVTIAAGETKAVELRAARNLLRPVPGLTALLLQFLFGQGLL